MSSIGNIAPDSLPASLSCRSTQPFRTAQWVVVGRGGARITNRSLTSYGHWMMYDSAQAERHNTMKNRNGLTSVQYPSGCIAYRKRTIYFMCRSESTESIVTSSAQAAV